MSTQRLFAVICLVVLVSAPSFAQVDLFGGGADPFAPAGAAAPAKPAPAKPAPDKSAAQPKAKATAAHKLTSVEERLQAVLGQNTSQTFWDTPLEEAVQIIAETHNIPVVVDRRALEEVGLTPDTPVSLALKNVSLRSFFRLMLRELELTYMIKDEVIQVTTVEVAENNLILKMHVFPKSLIEKSEEIVRALQATVESDTWDTAGGPSSVVAIDNIMAVSATAYVHDQVADFVTKLEAAYQKSQTENQ